MPGNRIDMIERAAARLRRDAPAQKPVIEQGGPAQAAPGPVLATPANAPAQTINLLKNLPHSTAPKVPSVPLPH